jgi:hypothetical protein
MGGVSDITNRGDYDKLLLSELANDDDVLTTRLALNEALYLRRETPPSNPAQTRLVLIDCGLRMWGLPRFYATGVALSLAAQRSYSGETVLLRAEGESVSRVDVTSIEGLTGHLAVLRPEAHAGLALEALAQTAKEQLAETVLITCDDAWRDPEFRRHLRALSIEELFVFTVSRTGALRAFRHTLAGEKPIREATLSLESLLAPPPAAEAPRPAPLPLRDKHDPNELPLFLRTNPPPLLIPHHTNWKNAWYDDELGLFCISPYRQLTFWPQPNTGPLQYQPDLPARRLYWAGRAGEPSRVHFVVGDEGTNRFWLSAEGRSDGPTYFKDAEELHGIEHKVTGVAHHRDVLFLIGKRQVTEYAIASARKVASWTLPRGYKWTGHGRFFRRGWELHALASGSTMQALFAQPVQPPLLKTGLANVRWTAVDSPLGPVAIEVGGRFFTTHDNSWHVLDVDLVGPIRILAVARQHPRILVGETLAGNGGAKTFLLNVQRDGVSTTVLSPVVDPRKCVEFGSDATQYGHISLRRNVVDAAVLSNSDMLLYLGAKRGQILQLADNLNLRPMVGSQLDAGRLDEFSKSRRRFEPVTDGWNRGFSLSVASWKDGSRIYLDGRGLMHLVSGAPTLPQVTIVLSDLSAGWCSDGRVWGHPYFSGELAKTPPREIWDQVIRPLLRRIAYDGS